MPIKDFFWLSDTEFTHRLRQASDQDLMLDDKHNVRKRKGGKLGAWVSGAQAPMTLGISLFGTGIGIRNRHVAKRRLDMIHTELERRGLPKHAEDWKDTAFAVAAVGAGTAVGMAFVPGAEYAAQGLAEAGAASAASHVAYVATSQTAQSIGSQITEVSTAHFTDPDTYFNRPKALEAEYCAQPYYASASRTPSPPTLYARGVVPTPPPQYGQCAQQYLPLPPAPYYG